MTPKEKHEALLWIGVAGGGAVLFYVLLPKSQPVTPPTRRGVPSHVTSSAPDNSPNPQQGTIDEAFIAARDQALQAYDQTILGEKSAADQLTAINNETQAQKLIAFHQDTAALKMAGIEGTTARDIAGTQASAEENIASQEASAMGQAEHAQQQQSLWGSILGIFGQAFSFLGFNNPYANPVSYGSGNVYYDSSTGQQINPDIYTQTPTDPYSWDYIPSGFTFPQIQVPQNFSIGG